MFIYGCGLTNSNLVKIYDINSVKIETPGDRANVLFKEHLKRVFKSNKDMTYKYLLKASITFSSSETLSLSGTKALNRTVANVHYELYDVKVNKLIKSGSIKSFPAIRSTSNSLYANDTSLKHIKERLNFSISQKVYMHLNIILRRLK